MLEVNFQDILYQGKSSCLDSPFYELKDPYGHIFCGPCSIRHQFLVEIPSQVTMRKLSDAGTPDFNPHFNGHLLVVLGLFPPNSGEQMHKFRERRKKISQPIKGLFPTTSALWQLMGNQPPLAIPLLEFCQGYNEVSIAERHSWSLWSVQERLGKGSRAVTRTVYGRARA
jgi:hypothetical protein